MKRVTVVLIVSLLVIALTAIPVAAAAPTSVTLSWTEDATRYYPDGTVWSSWTGDANGPMELLQTGKAYHVVDIGEFYNQTLPDVEGSMVISGAGKFSGHATYTSLASGLPIKELMKGDISVDPDNGVMTGSYTQYAYAFGSQEDVMAHYPKSVPEKSENACGWWFIGYTEYTAY